MYKMNAKKIANNYLNKLKFNKKYGFTLRSSRTYPVAATSRSARWCAVDIPLTNASKPFTTLSLFSTASLRRIHARRPIRPLATAFTKVVHAGS